MRAKMLWLGKLLYSAWQGVILKRIVNFTKHAVIFFINIPFSFNGR